MQILIDGEACIKIDDNKQAIHVEQEEYGPCNFTYDNNGNVISYTYRAWNDERVRTVNFTYNDDNGIFRYVKTPSWFLTTQLNCMVVSVTNKINYQNLFNNCATVNEDTYTLYKYEYEYNSDSQPVAVDEIPVGVLANSTLSFEIEYIEANDI